MRQFFTLGRHVAVVSAVVGAGADGTMGLSQAVEGDRRKFKVDSVPTQTDIAGGCTTKLFIVGKPSEALEFCNGCAYDLLVPNHFQLQTPTYTWCRRRAIYETSQ